MTAPGTCRWIGCTRLAERDDVCRRCRARTFAAGKRAAAGVDRERVRAAIAMIGRPPSPVRDRLEDLEWLLECGEDPERAARRCGWTRTSAMEVARRHGRFSIADRMREGAIYA